MLFGHNKIFRLFSLILAFLFFFSTGINVNSQFVKGQTDPQAVYPLEIGDGFTTYLPVVISSTYSSTPFGVIITRVDSAGGLDLFKDIGLSWVRRDIPWSLVEDSEGARNWPLITEWENELINASRNGMQMVLTIESTPQWALKPGYQCGAVAPEKLDALGNYVFDLVSRYSAYPYNVKYWELWNEPDVVNFLGCWGQAGDPYYGGEYYGEMLKKIYPRIKQADHTAQVMVGGLLLDCDPDLDPNCISAKFIKGIIKNGGGSYFDGVSFHSYDYFTGLGTYNSPNWNSSWNTSGPVTIAKLNYLKNSLKEAGIQDKFFMNTETALLCAWCGALKDYSDTKKYYIVHSYTVAIVENLRANIWWSVFGDRGSGLVNEDFTPQPSYYAYRFTSQMLSAAEFKRYLNFPGVAGYEFLRGNRYVWVLWSKDGNTHQVPLDRPTGIYHIQDDGRGAVDPLTSSIDVGIAPYFVEFAP